MAECAEKILEIARGFQASRILLTGYELGIFQTIGEYKLTSAEVASRINADSRATDRLMNALVVLGLLEKENDLYSNSTDALGCLVPGKPGYTGGALGHTNNLWDTWSTLTEAVKKGTSVVERKDEARADFVKPFIAAMHFNASRSAKAVIPEIDLTEIKRLLDVGGGSGYKVAQVGCGSRGMVHLDSRLKNSDRFEELGAKCAVDIFGSYVHGNGSSAHVAQNFSKEAFDEAVEMARYFIDQVKPKTAHFCYEIFPFNVIDSPEMIAKLITAVDRKQFAVHMDLVNLINCPRAYWTSGDIMRECVKLFGDRIVSAHAKDIAMRQPAISVILEEVLPGKGNLDIAANIRELHNLPHTVPYMIEHLPSEAEYDQAAKHIRSVAYAEGIVL